uniref:PT domain-containing protein n=1 Tax=Wenzhouxiangella sp. EGI_FJ10409 TaxID=3243767 RepID=UPI0035D76576
MRCAHAPRIRRSSAALAPSHEAFAASIAAHAAEPANQPTSQPANQPTSQPANRRS